MTKHEAALKVMGMVEEAIKVGKYSIVREAEDIACEHGVEMGFYDDYITVEDERFDFNGAF